MGEFTIKTQHGIKDYNVKYIRVYVCTGNVMCVSACYCRVSVM